MDEDYELPVVEKVAGEILRGLVPQGHIGWKKKDVYDEYAGRMYAGGFAPTSDEDFDYIILRRRNGYFDEDNMTDYSGLEVICLSSSRTRSVKMSNEATKLLLRSQSRNVLGFPVDHVEVLNGPDDNESRSMDEHAVEKQMELHLRAKFI